MEEKLISRVAAYPVLYDSSRYLYRDVNKKNEAWRRVVNVVGAPGGFLYFCTQIQSSHIS